MKRRTLRKKRSFSRRGKKQRRLSRRRRQRGGAELAVPEGSIVGVDLDPKDAYSVPVLVRKAVYEEEVLDD